MLPLRKTRWSDGRDGGQFINWIESRDRPIDPVDVDGIGGNGGDLFLKSAEGEFLLGATASNEIRIGPSIAAIRQSHLQFCDRAIMYPGEITFVERFPELTSILDRAR